MKKILGLDLGTNSIGWALVNQDMENNKGSIIDAGCRIIPMSQEIMGEFEKGNSISQTADRTGFRGTRRLRERQLLRRERLHRTLNILDFLPKHYANLIDFEEHPGKFKQDTEPKLVYDEHSKFIFIKSFNEMLIDFAKSQPKLVANGKKVPYDWTIYYLRKKALKEKIEKEELAWLILNFNQKRGYYQLRGEDDNETPDKLIEFHELKVVKVEDSGDKKKDDVWYNVFLENGWIYRRSSKIPLYDWVNKTKEFIVTTDLNDDGTIKTDKDGKEKRSFKAVNSEEDWIAIKKSTEDKIEKSYKTVGSYIYDTLLQNPNQKINGKLVRTIERKFYKAELQAILAKQKEFHSELQSEKLYNLCLEELYANNYSHRNSIGNKDLVHLFLNDIIFYQRPLKSKKSLISNCRYESRTYKKEDGTFGIEPIKCIAKSHPLFQEFRLWQWMKNLKIFVIDTDKDVTSDFLKTEDDWVKLFDWLNSRKEVDQKAFLKYPAFELKKEVEKYRWNFVADKSYPCNETRSQILSRLLKVGNVTADFLTKEIEEALWHILYSVEDKFEIEKALKTFANKHNLGEDFVEAFKKYPRIEKEYGSYSAKAIKKLLPLMQMGKYWSAENIHTQTKERIEKIINGEADEKIKNRVREKTIKLTDINDFKALPLWLVCYIVYNRHAEEGDIKKWHTAVDIELLEQHSLRNPIVEQVINETLQVVRDIWKAYGAGKENFFDEIHIELGRDMKNPADKRKQITNQNTENENTNLRIKTLLVELLNDKNIENVRPFSPSQQELLKIYEDGVLCSENEIPDDILKISKTSLPTSSELNRYKLWLEQKYRSPYTGAIIPLSRLFTPDYEIEHIIPQSRFFDDSFSNKVICESEVNKLKDNQLSLEFIQNHHGEKIALNFNKTATILSEIDYQEFVKLQYANSKGKMKKLLLVDIPEKMIERQLNDTRYISKVVKNLLSNIVRVEGEEETTSKNVLSSNGTITSTLKQDWGLNDIWNDIIATRFIRMNELTKSNNFGEINPNTNKFLPKVPIELQKGFNKKRIDHRHHAMDALVIACASRNHINYLNNEYAKADKKDARYDLKNILCYKKYNEGSSDNYKWIFKKPWDSFTVDAKGTLQTILVSFKQNLRVINKTVNNYQKWVPQSDGTLKKEFVRQTKGDSWAVRKPMHKDTVFGEVTIKRNGKIMEGHAVRMSLTDKFTRKQLESVTDTGVKQILERHIENYVNEKGEEQFEIAFNVEGIDTLNQNIVALNKGRNHKPINKVRVYESGNKFAIGYKGNKGAKFVEAAKGTNLFFAIYADENGKRNYETIALNIVIERQKQGMPSVPEKNDKGHGLLFYLSPNDLVFVPNEDEKNSFDDFSSLSKEQLERVYKVVSFSGTQLFLVKNSIANPIVNKVEFSALNKTEKSIEGIMIKDCCWKLNVSRIGKINKVQKVMLNN